MVLDQGVLRPGRRVTRKTELRKRTQKKQGLSVGSIDRLLQTGKPNICIIRSLGGIGDVLMSTPMLRALKYRWPESRITYATDFQYMDGALKDVLLYNPYIDELLQYQAVASKEYDLKTNITSVCVGLEKPGVSVPNRIDLFAEHVGISLEKSGYLPVYIVSDEEKKWAKEKLSRYPRRRSDSPRIGIQVRSSTMSRSWPINMVRELAVRLVNELGAQVVMLDSSHGAGPVEVWNMPGLIPLKDYGIRRTAAIIDEMDLIIAPDSGLMHIAGALNKKIVSIWAGTDPAARINHYPNAVSIAREEYACWPCWYSSGACDKNYLCIKSITVDEVLEATAAQLETELKQPEVVVRGLPIRATGAFTDNAIERGKYVLINRCSGFGDVLMCTALVKTLKQRYPELYIGFRTNHPEILEGIEEVDEIILGQHETSPTLEQNYRFGHMIDLNFAVEAPTVSGVRAQATNEEYMSVPRIELFYRKAGLDMGEFPGLQYCISDKEKEYTKEILEPLKDRQTVVYIANSVSPYRTYYARGAVEVIKDLCQDFNVIGTGTIDKIWGSEHPFCKTYHNGVDSLDGYIDLMFAPLREAIATMAEVDLVITPDTGMLHAAAAVGTPCIGLFGNIDPSLRCSFYPKVYPLFAQQPCFKDCGDRPAINNRCPSRKLVDDKKIRLIGAQCMRAIEPNQITWLARQILSEQDE
jgi:heptosyltransferase-2